MAGAAKAAVEDPPSPTHYRSSSAESVDGWLMVDSLEKKASSVMSTDEAEVREARAKADAAAAAAAAAAAMADAEFKIAAAAEAAEAEALSSQLEAEEAETAAHEADAEDEGEAQSPKMDADFEASLAGLVDASDAEPVAFAAALAALALLAAGAAATAALVFVGVDGRQDLTSAVPRCALRDNLRDAPRLVPVPVSVPPVDLEYAGTFNTASLLLEHVMYEPQHPSTDSTAGAQPSAGNASHVCTLAEAPRSSTPSGLWMSRRDARASCSAPRGACAPQLALGPGALPIDPSVLSFMLDGGHTVRNVLRWTAAAASSQLKQLALVAVPASESLLADSPAPPPVRGKPALNIESVTLSLAEALPNAKVAVPANLVAPANLAVPISNAGRLLGGEQHGGCGIESAAFEPYEMDAEFFYRAVGAC